MKGGEWRAARPHLTARVSGASRVPHGALRHSPLSSLVRATGPGYARLRLTRGEKRVT